MSFQQWWGMSIHLSSFSKGIWLKHMQISQSNQFNSSRVKCFLNYICLVQRAMNPFACWKTFHTPWIHVKVGYEKFPGRPILVLFQLTSIELFWCTRRIHHILETVSTTVITIQIPMMRLESPLMCTFNFLTMPLKAKRVPAKVYCGTWQCIIAKTWMMEIWVNMIKFAVILPLLCLRQKYLSRLSWEVPGTTPKYQHTRTFSIPVELFDIWQLGPSHPIV